MKALLFFLLLIVATLLPARAQMTPEEPFQTNYEMTLVWAENDPVELVTTYRVYIDLVPAPNQTNAVQKVVEVAVPGVPLVDILRNEPNGLYRIFVTAVSSNGLESGPSQYFWLFWHWRPTPPRELGVIIERR